MLVSGSELNQSVMEWLQIDGLVKRPQIATFPRGLSSILLACL
jgi:hypothetical protein